MTADDTQDSSTVVQTAPPAAGDQGGGQGKPPDTAGADTGAASDAGKTQADIDRIVEARLARERKAAEKTQAELQAKLEAYEAEKKAAELAKLDEVERAKLEADEAKAAAAKALADLNAARLDALRANLIATEAATLPTVYKAAVTGTTAEEITASIAAVKEQFEADKAAFLADAKAPPQNLGTHSRPGEPGSPPAQYDPASDANSMDAWRAERKRRGYAQR